MQVLVAMSGGVDSSVAAAMLLDAGHDVVGVTMKLWGGQGDSGCCSVSDVDDARRVAQQLGIDHAVFNFGDDFTRHVVDPYVAAHREGRTPNPCVECNRHLKFERLLERADLLGFDCVATGHHARVVAHAGGYRLRRGADRAKDQSYVLHMLGQPQLSRVLLPVGDLDKSEVRARASALGLRTASKPDSQDVCFITKADGRRAFLSDRMPLRPGRVIDTRGAHVADVDAIELVTVGQRRGLGAIGGERVVRACGRCGVRDHHRGTRARPARRHDGAHRCHVRRPSGSGSCACPVQRARRAESGSLRRRGARMGPTSAHGGTGAERGAVRRDG